MAGCHRDGWPVRPLYALTDFLEKLNNGDKFSREAIEVNYNKIQPSIDLLYTVDDFPVDHEDEDIYCFIDFKRKHFDKYHIQDIADIVINYNKNVEYYTGNPVKIITDCIFHFILPPISLPAFHFFESQTSI